MSGIGMRHDPQRPIGVGSNLADKSDAPHRLEPQEPLGQFTEYPAFGNALVFNRSRAIHPRWQRCQARRRCACL